jgi:hypothetical protein
LTGVRAGNGEFDPLPVGNGEKFILEYKLNCWVIERLLEEKFTIYKELPSKVKEYAGFFSDIRTVPA